MKSAIWDLDGTLINSYGLILDSLVKTVNENGIDLERSYIEDFIKRRSVNEIIHEISKNFDIEFLGIKRRFSEISRQEMPRITLMPDVQNVLCQLRKSGVRHYLFTHKGESTEQILKNLNVNQYFTELITGVSGYKRKPDAEAILYILDKYKINKSDAFYIGDRDIDIECAKNADIRSIILKSKYITKKADFEIQSLKEICPIFADDILQTSCDPQKVNSVIQGGTL